MNMLKTAVCAVTLLAGTSWGTAATPSAAKRPARPAQVVDLRADELSPKTAELIRVAEKECQCSEWEITYEEHCVQWDGQGNCTKNETVRRRKCVAWDHCHEKA